MRPLIATAAVLALAGLGACAQAPIPQTYPVSQQLRMQSAAHWDTLAQHVAQRLNQQLPGGDRGIALYVAPPAQKTEFDLALHELLITHLVQYGFSISESPYSGALAVSLETQVITAPDADTEIIVNTSVMDGQQFRARLSDIFYVNSANEIQYVGAPVRPDLSRRLEVVGS